MGQELLLIEGVNKEFPGVKALSNMHLNLKAGEVLAVVGDRKSTRLNSSHVKRSRMPSSA